MDGNELRLQWRSLAGLDNETTPDSEPPGLRPIRLRKVAERRMLKTFDRHLYRVDATLLTVLGGLVTGKRPWPLYLWGPVGTGKTCAALALCDAVQLAWYDTVGELVDRIMAGRSATDWELLGSPAYDLVVLDEIGERTSDVYRSAVKRVCDIRELHKRSAVYVSNLPPEELNSGMGFEDDRVADRLLCGTVFYLDGPSRRMPEGGTQ